MYVNKAKLSQLSIKLKFSNTVITKLMHFFCGVIFNKSLYLLIHSSNKNLKVQVDFKLFFYNLKVKV